MHQILHQAIHFLPSHRSRNDRSLVILTQRKASFVDENRLKRSWTRRGRIYPPSKRASMTMKNEEMFRTRVDEA